MILTGPEIIAAYKRGDITCDPFRPANVGPASLDLTLSDVLLTYRRPKGKPLDMAAEPETHRRMMMPHPFGFLLEPGIIYIASTVECVGVGRYAGQVADRSSVARLGVKIQTAGFVDPGFHGTITLEISVVEPVVVYPHVRVCQLWFAEMVGRPSGYVGKYQGQRGPRASEMWRDFLPKGEDR